MSGAWRAVLLVGALGCSTPTGSPDEGTSTSTGAATAVEPTEAATESGATTTDESSSGETGEPLPSLPPLSRGPLTTEKTLVPTHELDTEHGLDPRIVADMDELLRLRYGLVHEGGGEPLVDRTLDASPPPSPGPRRRLLTRFVHLADSQLIDDESPVRAATADLPIFPYPFRAQEAYSCQVLNAAVRTINAVHRDHPIDFVVLGGDNIDSAQANELEWFLGILDGAMSIHCDSGVDDDPEPGPDNDPKDPFGPVTLDVPWWWVSGNHDILVQGLFRQTAAYQDIVAGSVAEGGTRDWSQPGGPVVQGMVPADPDRAFLPSTEVLQRVAASGDGHGIDAGVIERGRGHYTFDQGGVRFVVVESATADGSTDGVIVERDVSDFLRPALDGAEADGLPVVIVSHHASTQMTDGSDFGGTAHEDAYVTEDWRQLLGEYPNVLMHLAGHVHHHRIRAVAPQGGTPYWEVLTAALADFPHQVRLVEIRDEDNGFYSVTGIAIDYRTKGDPLAADARARGVADLTSGWLEDGAGDPEDRNVVLWVPR